MGVILLAPYNDSMQLGQGFNSFLQLPCINDAVDIPESSLKTQAARTGGPTNVSQVVSYSSRFVEKISDVVRSMNISAASSIKSGTIEVSGNSLTVDESKFASSDLNAVISVKVINQTTTAIKDPKFNPLKDSVVMDSEKFFRIYGDCYISGFMEGGDLHGIVSIKVLDATKKTTVESALKGAMNGSAGEFTLSEGSGSSELDAALRETESTVTVNWSGGGQIKADNQEWTLDSLIRVASGFPGRVATCPQRTWAILTPYNRNRSFVEWADARSIKVPVFSQVQQYAHDLLDSFMEFKNNLAKLQAAMANPLAFRVSSYNNAINLGVQDLVDERKAIKDEMAKIVRIIDELNTNPLTAAKVEIRSPEVWATRLPIPINDPRSDGNRSVDETAKLISGFSFVDNPIKEVTKSILESHPGLMDKAKDSKDEDEKKRPKSEESASPENPIPLADIYPANDMGSLNTDERQFVSSDLNKRLYSQYRFSNPMGFPRSDTSTLFNDAEKLREAMHPVSWPRRLEFTCSVGSRPRITQIRVLYDQMHLSHGSSGRDDVPHENLSIDLGPDEKINRLLIGSESHPGIAFIEVHTTAGNVRSIGRVENYENVDYYRPSDDYPVFKGFWGRTQGDEIARLGSVWGR